MRNISRRDLGRLGIATAIAGLTGAGRVHPAGASDAIKPPDAFDYLDPELRPAARQMMQAGNLQFSDAMLAEARRTSDASAERPLSDVPVSKRLIPGAPRMPDVTLYVVNARNGAPRPAILHIHGGGHVIGKARSELRYLQQLARNLDCIIVTVEYRLAPETRYNGSVEDVYAALLWTYRAADEIGVDRTRIALLGESAGGCHAALLAIAARDRGEVPLVLQALIYPMLDDRTGSTRQMPPFIGRILWDGPANRYGWKSFLGVEPGSADVPAGAVPARIERLAGLPPTFIGVGGVDLFVSEDIDYARRLTEAGVPTELLVVPGAFHAFDRVAPEARISLRFTRAKMDALRRAFGLPVTL